MTIRVPAAVAEQIRSEGEKGYPHEIVGVLLGADGDPRCVARAVQVPNVSEEDHKRRYFVDPLEYARIEREADARGEAVLGFYHTHPDHPARPSEEDRRWAVLSWPGYSFLILSVEKGRATVWTSWRIEESSARFAEEGVV